MNPRLPLSLCALLLSMTSCAAFTTPRERPNSYQDLRSEQDRTPKDRLNYLDPTIGAQRPPPPSNTASTCQRQCGPGLRCDASGPLEQCVPIEPAKK
jgi:hypothetical protein